MATASATPTPRTAVADGPDPFVPAQRPSTGRPIVVATDASPSADSAFAMAKLLAHRCGAEVEVLTVLEPAVIHVRTPYPFVTPLDGAKRMEELRARARHQLEALISDNTGWVVDARYGEPAPTIRRMARERNAELVIMGVGRHGVMDRLYGEETTGHVAEIITTPLLATAVGSDRLPRTVVVAIATESTAVPMSPVLRTLLSEIETVHFVNARPDATEFPLVPPLWDPLYFDEVVSACELVKSSLDLPAAVYREPVAVSGHPAKAILAFADEVKADLIIVGQRRGLLRRWIGGGLAGRLLRGTTHSMLIVPRPQRARGRMSGRTGTAAGHTTVITDRHLWAARLAAISSRNAGRQVTLEVDDSALGAGAEATDFPFLGMDYDHTDDSIAIMIGNPAGGTSHLTHTVAAPESVDILEGVDGTTVAVRVENAHGGAAVSFLG